MASQVGGMSNEPAEPVPFVDNPRLWEGLPSQTNRYDDVFAGPRVARTMMPGSQSALTSEDRYCDTFPAPYTLNAKTPTEFDRFTPVHYVKVDNELASTLAAGVANPLLRLTNTSSSSLGQSAGTIAHPEGGPISYRGCIVSTQNLTDSHVAIAGHILGQCKLPAENAEITLFLYILGRQIDYYVVDHQAKAIVWVTGQMPESLKGAARAKHEHEYWIHMENFPGPHFSTPEDLRSLRQVLSSNAIDALTSEGSTSPMSVQQIQTHLKSLESFSSGGDIHQTYAVARLWNLILQSRVINKHGTPEARLDRFISVTDNPPVFAGTYASIARLMFKRHHSNLWADRIAYTEEWRRFKTNEREQDRVKDPVARQLMSAFQDLRKGGHNDLTGQLDFLQSSEYAIKLGGSGEIYQSKVSGARALVAIRIERWTKNLTDDQKVESLKHVLHHSLIWSLCTGKHPNIHQFLGVAEYRDQFALVSPLMTHGDLGQFLSLRSLSQARLYEMCSQICSAVAFLHELGIIHGDIKAQNILVSDDFVLKIMDFGNARHIGGRWDSLVSNRVWQFSLHWAPREMLEEKAKPTVPGDVHSLGMTLHEVTSGSIPYAGMIQRRVYLNILNGVLPPRSPSQNEQQDLLWALLMRCWARDARDRPTAAQVRAQMRLISSQVPHTLHAHI